jgi:hypothetical protein
VYGALAGPRGERDTGLWARPQGGFTRLTPLGLFLHTSTCTVYMAYSKCLPTRLNPCWLRGPLLLPRHLQHLLTPQEAGQFERQARERGAELTFSSTIQPPWCHHRAY